MSIYKEYRIDQQRGRGWGCVSHLGTAITMFIQSVGQEPEVVLCTSERGSWARDQVRTLPSGRSIQVVERRLGRPDTITLGVGYDEAERVNESKVGTSGLAGIGARATIEERKKVRGMAKKKERAAAKEAKIKEAKIPKVEKVKIPKVEKVKITKEPKANRNPLGVCWCGCGAMTATNSRYLPGHDGRLHGRLYKHEAGEPQKGGGALPENYDFLVERVFPLLPVCKNCGNPYIEAKGKDGIGPYCLATQDKKG